MTPVPGFRVTGTWNWSGPVLGPMAAQRETIYSLEAGSTATWDPGIYSPVDVRISIYRLVSPRVGGDPKMRFEVAHDGAVKEVFVDGTGGESGWHELGTFRFSGQGDEFVRLVKETPHVATRASAVRFEILNEPGSAIRVWQTLYVNADTIVDWKILEEASSFLEISGHPAEPDIRELESRGLFDDSRAGAFRPNDALKPDEASELVAGILAAGDAETAARHRAALLGRMGWDGPESRAGPVPLAAFHALLGGALELSGKNLSWAGPREALEARLADILEIPISNREALARGEAASILARWTRKIFAVGPPGGGGWEIAFEDRFEGDSLDWEVWGSQAGPSGHVLSSRWPENVEVRDGLLRLVTRREERGGQEWTSANIWVKPEVFSQAYGYWEARYRYAPATGLNNAWWMNAFYRESERSFEIDINEGHYPNRVNMSLHYRPEGETRTRSDQARHAARADLSSGFHVYGLEWTPEELVFYLDGQEIDRKPARNAQWPVSPRFSTAVMRWAGPVTDALDGASMDVDWVRVWRRRPADESDGQ